MRMSGGIALVGAALFVATGTLILVSAWRQARVTTCANHLALIAGAKGSHGLENRLSRGSQVAPHHLFALNRLPRLADGDVLVAVTTDEENPSAVQPFGRPNFWDYGGSKVTQFWRKPAAAIANDLHCAVNARFTYYGTGRPIPGGVAFENFELRQRFRDGDEFVFGVS